MAWWMDPAWLPLVTGPLAFVLMLVLTPLTIRLARWRGWVAQPKADRWHQQATALMGGVAIFGAATLAALLSGILPSDAPIWIGATVMFCTGFVDDRRHLSPAVKFTAQVVATVALLYGGYAFAPAWPFWLSVPLTFLWVTGITNALNLLDNMDGLASGTAAIALASLAAFAALAGEPSSAALPLAVAGAAAGFLIYNFKPARIFMGDCGSLFLGYLVAAYALAAQTYAPPEHDGIGVYVVSLAVLALPIFDTTLVSFLRSMAGRPVSQGGRDHSSHRLVALGLSERAAVLTLYAVSATFGGIALLFHFTDAPLFYALLLFAAVALVVFGAHLGTVDAYADAPPSEAEGLPTAARLVRGIRGAFGPSWKLCVGLVGDLLLVTASLIAAYYLRFETGLNPQREAFLLAALPAVVAVKLAVFLTAGMYRGVWRHAGTPELVRIGLGSLAASAVAFLTVGLLFGFEAVSRAAFLIDWMITTLALATMRLGFRGLRQYLFVHRTGGRRVLLYGAGDAGLMTLRELRQNAERGLQAVAFLDDDPAKRGLCVQDLPIVGGLERLPEALRLYQADMVLLTTRSISPTRRAAIAAACEQAGVTCGEARLSIEPLLLEDLSGDGAAVEVSQLA